MLLLFAAAALIRSAPAMILALSLFVGVGIRKAVYMRPSPLFALRPIDEL